MMPLMGSLERILLGNPLGGSYTGGEKSMWEQGTIYTQNGAEGDSDYRVRSGYIPVRSNVYYTQRTLSGGYTLIQWYYYDSEYQYLGYFSDDTWKKLLLTPVNCAYIRIVILNPTDVPLYPTDVPNITIEDRSIWGWKDVDAYNAIYSTKTVTTQIDHYYYQNNQNKFTLRVNIPNQVIYIRNGDMVKSTVSREDSQLYVLANEGATTTNIGDLVFEDRDVWGWRIQGVNITSLPINIDKIKVNVDYSGDLLLPRVSLYNGSTFVRSPAVPFNEVVTDANILYLYIQIKYNPNITPADMVNHGTWTVTFSDPVSEVWQSDGSVYYTPHNSEIQKGKILAITPPSSFKAVSLVVQDSTGQNSHDITGGAEVTLSESTEWVYLTVGIAENPDVNLTNIDSFREQWSYSYKDIPAPVEPHWDGENFVFTAADIKEGKAYQKSGNDIILVDDASSIALPIIPNVSAAWTILIDNSSDSPLNGVEIRKTASGVTVGDGTINANAGRSVILQDAAGEVAFHFTKATLTAESLYNALKIHGR